MKVVNIHNFSLNIENLIKAKVYEFKNNSILENKLYDSYNNIKNDESFFMRQPCQFLQDFIKLNNQTYSANFVNYLKNSFNYKEIYNIFKPYY